MRTGISDRRKRTRSKRKFSPSSRKEERKKIASRYISNLIDMSVKESSTHPELARRHAEISWSISTRFNVRLGNKRRFFCRYCKSFALPGLLRYRLSKKRKGMNITCLRCGKTYHKLL